MTNRPKGICCKSTIIETLSNRCTRNKRERNVDVSFLEHDCQTDRVVRFSVLNSLLHTVQPIERRVSAILWRGYKKIRFLELLYSTFTEFQQAQVCSWRNCRLIQKWAISLKRGSPSVSWCLCIWSFFRRDASHGVVTHHRKWSVLLVHFKTVRGMRWSQLIKKYTFYVDIQYFDCIAVAAYFGDLYCRNAIFKETVLTSLDRSPPFRLRWRRRGRLRHRSRAYSEPVL